MIAFASTMSACVLNDLAPARRRRGFHDAPVHDDVVELETDDLVVDLQASLFQGC